MWLYFDIGSCLTHGYEHMGMGNSIKDHWQGFYLALIIMVSNNPSHGAISLTSIMWVFLFHLCRRMGVVRSVGCFILVAFGGCALINIQSSRCLYQKRWVKNVCFALNKICSGIESLLTFISQSQADPWRKICVPSIVLPYGRRCSCMREYIFNHNFGPEACSYLAEMLGPGH